MGTYIKVIPEMEICGRFESADFSILLPSEIKQFKEAVSVLESQNYFKFAMWLGIRNKYGIETPFYNPPVYERSMEDRDEILYTELGYEPLYPINDDLHITYSELNASMDTAHEINKDDISYCTLIIDDLLNFNYNQPIMFINPRKPIPDEDMYDFSNYLCNLEEKYVESLQNLRIMGFTRLVIIVQ